MTTEEALLAEVARDPRNTDVRLVLADFYAEAGRPDLEWAQREIVAARPVLDDPADDQARRDFADFCEAQGKRDRAEMIRASLDLFLKPRCPEWCPHTPERCDAARLAETVMRCLAACRSDYHLASSEWLVVPSGDEARGPWLNVCFVHRGFVERVFCDGDAWARTGPDLVLRHPIASVLVRTLPGVVAEFQGKDSIYRLSAAPNLTQITRPEVLLPTREIAAALFRKAWPSIAFRI